MSSRGNWVLGQSITIKAWRVEEVVSFLPAEEERVQQLVLAKGPCVLANRHPEHDNCCQQQPTAFRMPLIFPRPNLILCIILSGVAWGCDLSYEYVRINGEVRALVAGQRPEKLLTRFGTAASVPTWLDPDALRPCPGCAW